MPSIGKLAAKALRAGTKTTRSTLPGGTSRVEPLPKIARALPNPGNAKSWRSHIIKDKAAAYRIPEGVEDAVSAPGYVQIQQNNTRYLVKKEVAVGLVKQDKKQLRRIG